MDSVQWTMLGICSVLFFWALGAYNRLQRLRNQIARAADQIEESVCRRDELLAGFLTLLKPAAHPSIERTTMEAVDAAGSAILAAAESLKERPVDPALSARVAVAEVGLGGELRQVQGMERRLAEAARLGFRSAVVARSSPEVDAPIELLRVPTLLGALRLTGVARTVG